MGEGSDRLPGLTPVNALIAVGAIHALYFALLVRMKRQRVLSDSILSLFLALVGVAFALVFCSLEFGWDVLLLPLVFSNLFYAPLFFLYIVAMVSPKQRLARRVLLHFVPFGLSLLYLLGLLLTKAEVELDLIFDEQRYQDASLLFDMFSIADLLAAPIYLPWSWKLLKRHQRLIGDRYSYRRSIDYAWLKRLILGAALGWMLIDLPLLGSVFIDAVTEEQSLLLGCSVVSVLVLYLGLHGFRQPFVDIAPAEPVTMGVAEVTPADESPARYRRSGLAEGEIARARDDLLEYMKSERPFLDAGLTIRELADAVGLTEHNVSEVINVGLGKNFYDFINSYRVDEFKRQVVEPSSTNLTLLAIALRCGFNSKSSFNRIFKQHCGITPSAFVRSGGGTFSGP